MTQIQLKMLLFFVLLILISPLVQSTAQAQLNTSQQFSIISDQYTTWGSRFIEGNKYLYSLSEGFTNECGVGCYSTSAVCSVWRLDKKILDINNAKWEFVSFVNKDSEDVVYCHDFSLTVETNGVDRYLAGYVTPMLNKKTKKYADAYVGNPGKGMCYSNISPFDTAGYIRELWSISVKLSPSLPIKDQIDSILSYRVINRQMLPINDLFLWTNIMDKIPPKYKGKPVVNPQQLIDTNTGYGPLIDGMRFSVHRTNTKNVRELLVIFAVEGSKFIWEDGARFVEFSQAVPVGAKEDGYFETDGNKFTIIYHDQALCGTRARYTCGAITESKDLINWTKPAKLYGPYIGDTKYYLRHRPSRLRYNGKVYLCNACAKKNAGFFNGKCNGGSRTICVLEK